MKKPSLFKPHALIYSGAVVLAGAMSLPAGAAAWEWNPTIEAGYLYDDNYRLAPPGDEIDVQGPMLDAELELRTLTQTGEFSFTPRVRATYFPDATDLDTVDYFASLNWLNRGQRVETRVRGEFAQQDIVNSEQPGVDGGGDLGEPDLGDGGVVLVDNRRTRCEPATLDEFRTVAAPRAAVRRRLHRRELRRRDFRRAGGLQHRRCLRPACVRGSTSAPR